jgi:hypothetical protein
MEFGLVHLVQQMSWLALGVAIILALMSIYSIGLMI